MPAQRLRSCDTPDVNNCDRTMLRIPFSALNNPTKLPEAVVLTQISPETAKKTTFRLKHGFSYSLPPDTGTLRGISGAIDVPNGFDTDLASVPTMFWWLIASYGRHTRAVLVHDALIPPNEVNGTKTPPPVEVERKVADYVLLKALEDGPHGPRGSYVRHQLTWAAVCLGTMKETGRLALAGLLLTVIAFWTAVGVTLMGGPGWWPDPAWIVAVVVFGVGLVAWKFNPYAHRKVAGRLWFILAIGAPLIAPSFVAVWGSRFIVLAIDLVCITIRSVWGVVKHQEWEWQWPGLRPTRVPL